jgi:hypothetical protein
MLLAQDVSHSISAEQNNIKKLISGASKNFKLSSIGENVP